MNFMLHSTAICESSFIGDDTRIWAFAHILSNARIGKACNICDHVFIENDVVIGDRVTIKCGVQLWDGITIADDVFIGPNVSFTNDKMPRSKVYPEKFLTTEIHKGVSIGANATLLPGIKIGQSAMIGAGAVVTKSVPAFAIVVGNPARVVDYIDAAKSSVLSEANSNNLKTASSYYSTIPNVILHKFPIFRDPRGSLSVAEFQKDIPFIPARFFFVYEVAKHQVRGEHAHKKCKQFLICTQGSCAVVIDDSNKREEIVLNSPNIGIYVPPLIWATEYKFSSDAVLLVFASDSYEIEDYITDYAEFCKIVAKISEKT